MYTISYRELKEVLENMTEEELDQIATVHTENGEFYPIRTVTITTFDDILAKGQIYLTV